MGAAREDKAMEDDVHAQSLLAIEHADVILFTVNSREELTASDFGSGRCAPAEAAEARTRDPRRNEVRQSGNHRRAAAEFPSARDCGRHHSRERSAPDRDGGIDDRDPESSEKLNFQKEGEIPMTSNIPRIAIIGQPNVGKSSIVNALMSEPDRKKNPKLVSDIPGTTRDATDTTVRHNDEEFIFVDTAGCAKPQPKPKRLRDIPSSGPCRLCS